MGLVRREPSNWARVPGPAYSSRGSNWARYAGPGRGRSNGARPARVAKWGLSGEGGQVGQGPARAVKLGEGAGPGTFVEGDKIGHESCVARQAGQPESCGPVPGPSPAVTHLIALARARNERDLSRTRRGPLDKQSLAVRAQTARAERVRPDGSQLFLPNMPARTGPKLLLPNMLARTGAQAALAEYAGPDGAQAALSKPATGATSGAPSRQQADVKCPLQCTYIFIDELQ